MKIDDELVIFWFRRDLRLEDNSGLYASLVSGQKVLPIFIFDTSILDELDDKNDKRVEFIWQELQGINTKLLEYNSAIQFYHGKPEDIFETLTNTYKIKSVFTNEDYEPYGIKRDQVISSLLAKKQIKLITHKDHVIFSPGEVLKDDGKPYTVYTPFMRKWKSRLDTLSLPSFPSEKHLGNLLQIKPVTGISIEKIGFIINNVEFPPKLVSSKVISNYHLDRDFPYLTDSTSRLGIHLRFGTLSIRKLVKHIRSHDIFLNELIWREFFIQILYYFPHVVHASFKPMYDQIHWNINEKDFTAWCRGETGYPLVDAGMRELNATGHMHNRVRMVVASFLCKHLFIDWRWGEAYFAQKLLDYELASNNGNWQWAAGSGCDAAPYFRIFNPSAQQKKFDPEMKYIKKWVDLNADYFAPIVNHEAARKRCLEVYAIALKNTA